MCSATHIVNLCARADTSREASIKYMFSPNFVSPHPFLKKTKIDSNFFFFALQSQIGKRKYLINSQPSKSFLS